MPKNPFKTPQRLALGTFGILIILSAISIHISCLLDKRPIGFVDSLFTATSAVCVTGLSVIDIGKDLSLPGQIILLLSIQIGGIGIVTLSTFFLFSIGRSPSLLSKVATYENLGIYRELNLRHVLIYVTLISIGIELIGTFFLFLKFYDGKYLLNSLYIALFHSVSAFCNAGFSLFSDSLIKFHSDVSVVMTVSGLIITGGIGFPVLIELFYKFFTKRSIKLSFHSKIVLFTTFSLLTFGFLFLLFTEWDKAYQGLGLREKILYSWFQSVTPRTAGFNTIDLNAYSNQSLFVIMLLMFIGAAPASTGGGIKVTTFFILICAGISKLKGFDRPHAFHRSVYDRDLFKAISVFMVSLGAIIFACIMALEFQWGSRFAMDRTFFFKLVFECVSAFGTVGLSLGITPSLSNGAKLVLIVLMFLGRLGPLVVATAISTQKEKDFYYVQEEVMIG